MAPNQVDKIKISIGLQGLFRAWDDSLRSSDEDLNQDAQRANFRPNDCNRIKPVSSVEDSTGGSQVHE